MIIDDFDIGGGVVDEFLGLMVISAISDVFIDDSYLIFDDSGSGDGVVDESVGFMIIPARFMIIPATVIRSRVWMREKVR